MSNTQKPCLIIVMGTSGCGKSSAGLAVAQELGLAFVDGDDLHPAANVAKMSRGEPLNDEDRIPWLHTIRRAAILLTSPTGLSALSHPSPAEGSAPLASEGVSGDLHHVLSKVHPSTLENGAKMLKRERKGVVVGCSALRVCYRDLLRGKEAKMREGLEVPAAEDQELETYFIYLHGTRPLLLNRMTSRPGHFFKASMLDSQLATLEPPSPETEEGVAVIRLGQGEGEAQERGMKPVCDDAVDAARKWVGEA
ncbi:P-loop containing nucleoside triphosphate hydrolase protein [Leucosporidium creatinivorum]|uniref:gluconokinase n=1 Tax=Leucosporidium creatinivorum TaxID=106004 RepID=A0A1Y2FMV5_9BASI|nr:P-loop containing nucleoside triphosphate hydrolase protein [Leucosporidium creatinivorum]